MGDHIHKSCKGGGIMENELSSLASSGDVLFMMLGAVMVFAMHGGFAFLEVGTVRKKNQVNALVKILVDFAISTLIYFFIGYGVAYGLYMFQPAEALLAKNQGYGLVHFFFLLTFAAAVPAIISGGIAERAKFWTQALAAAIFVGIAYPLFEGMVWGQITFLGPGSFLASQFNGRSAFS